MSAIYALIDPRTACIRYIGQTKDRLSSRLSEHLRAAKRERHPRAKWINKLAKQGLRPLIELVEITSDPDHAERFWIASLQASGADLVNRAVGGKSGVVWTAELRERMRQSRLGKRASEKTKKLISAAGIGLKRGPETKRRISAYQLGKTVTEAARKNISRAAKQSFAAGRVNPMLGKARPDLSARNRARKETQLK